MDRLTMKFILSVWAAIIVVILGLSLSACNRQMFDTTYKYSSAIISLPDGNIVSGKVQSWMDYEDGDQLQVKIDGTTYLVHSSNVVLIAD